MLYCRELDDINILIRPADVPLSYYFTTKREINNGCKSDLN